MVLSQTIMASPIRITLSYDGPEVATGTMPIEEVVEALQGFSQAYGHIATELSPNVTHQLRVSAIKTGSFDLFIIAAAYIAQNPDQLKALETHGHAARFVFDLIVQIVRAKKHTKGKPYQIQIKGDNNTVVVINAEGAELQIPAELVSLLKNKVIDTDLNKIVDPLQSGRIDSAKIRATDDEHPPIEETIAASDRDYFRPEAEQIILQEAEIVGRLISLNKDYNRGILRIDADKTVPYRFVGGRPERFHADFSYKGPVKLKGIVRFDGHLNPTEIEIHSVERLQSELNFTPSSGRR